jgi:putative secretion ATPase (PEP-CTERM system associated)
MYTAFYNLRDRPFQLSPDHRFFFGSQPHKKAMAYLTYGLDQSEGFIVITGEIGTGKTTLIDFLLAQLNLDRFLTAKVVTTQLEADDLLRIVASAFGIPQEGSDKATLLKKVESFLIENFRAGKRLLLVIDEAQNLPSGSLEELRMLSNFQLDQHPLLQIYLVGQPQFRRTLASESLEQLRQRVIATYHLEPLDAEETRGYIEHRLRQVDWRNDPSFTGETYHMIYEETGGVPRKINLLCDRLLLCAYLENKHQIDSAVVDEVTRDLHRERSRWSTRVADPPEAGSFPGSESPATSEEADTFAELAGRVVELERRLKRHEGRLRKARRRARNQKGGRKGKTPTQPRSR